MTCIELAPKEGEDLDRILDHIGHYQVENPSVRIFEIVEAIGILETNPLIGHPAGNGKRELVIGRRSYGYVALYRYVGEVDTVFVLTVRGQHEDAMSLRTCLCEQFLTPRK